MAETGDLISRVYRSFRGVDFRGEDNNLARSPDALNVWRDYKEVESIRTRPSMEQKVYFPAPVYGVFFFNGTMLVHSGKNLYTVTTGGAKTIIYSALNQAVSESFVYENIFYLKDGLNYLQYDGTTIKEVVGYVPTTSIGRKPNGGGTIYEDVNLLSSRRINTFLADGESKEFVLDATGIDEVAPVVKVNDEVVANYTVDYEAGKITFAEAPTAPLTDGQDNVSVEFEKTVEGYSDRILKCTLLQVFDNRVFFSGNKEYPNTVWHCSLNDPSYCSDLDYYNEGLDNARINGLVASNNNLLVFREPSDANTTVFYHTPLTDQDYGKIYPSQHSNIAIGCVGKAINFNDDIVFFSERGMEGISGEIATEQVVAHRSSLVDRKMIAESDYKNMILAEWEGYLFVFIGDKAYLADSRAMFTNEDHMEYEFFYWDMGHKITCAKVNNGVLYLGTEDGVYTLTGKENVESYWTTPKDRFNAPQKLKSTHKRGCVAEAMGDFSVYAKVEDTDFELIAAHENVTDYCVTRIKRKKWKDIQVKFHSQTRFSLETVTLECFIGAYLKR